MSGEIENNQSNEVVKEEVEELEELNIEEAQKNSVPIVSDKEIDAVFVGGVPVEADEGKKGSKSHLAAGFRTVRQD